jgi:hypothetical protein
MTVDGVGFYAAGHAAKSGKLRAMLADRLSTSAGWQRARNKSDLSVEIRIGPAIATMFFNDYNLIGNPSCYLRGGGINQVDPFFPQLTNLMTTSADLQLN